LTKMFHGAGVINDIFGAPPLHGSLAHFQDFPTIRSINQVFICSSGAALSRCGRCARCFVHKYKQHIIKISERIAKKAQRASTKPF